MHLRIPTLSKPALEEAQAPFRRLHLRHTVRDGADSI